MPHTEDDGINSESHPLSLLAHFSITFLPSTMIVINHWLQFEMLKSCPVFYIEVWVSALGSLIYSLNFPVSAQVTNFDTHTQNKCIPNTIQHYAQLSSFILFSQVPVAAKRRPADCRLQTTCRPRVNPQKIFLCRNVFGLSSYFISGHWSNQGY